MIIPTNDDKFTYDDLEKAVYFYFSVDKLITE